MMMLMMMMMMMMMLMMMMMTMMMGSNPFAVDFAWRRCAAQWLRYIEPATASKGAGCILPRICSSNGLDCDWQCSRVSLWSMSVD
eukprot:2244615-Amphidinium_carterae.1